MRVTPKARTAFWAGTAGLLALALLLAGCLSQGGPARPVSEQDRRIAAQLESGLKLADRLEDDQMRALILSRVAERLLSIDTSRAAAVLARAEDIALRCDNDDWRLQAQQLAGAGRGWPRELREQALSAADRIMTGSARSWGLRAVAEVYLGLDRGRAAALADRALEITRKNIDDDTRDLDLRGLSGLLARIDRGRAMAVAGRIGDPLVQAWALREIAAAAGRAGQGDVAGQLYERAMGAARTIKDPYRRCTSLCQIASSWAAADPAHARRAIGAALEAAGALRQGWLKNYALSSVAAAYAPIDREAAMRLALRLDPAFPEARFYAFNQIALATAQSGRRWKALDGAFREALKIGFDFERDKAVALVAGEMAQADPRRALTMTDAIRAHDDLVRGQALAGVMPLLGPLDFAEGEARAAGIRNPFYRSLAWSALGERTGDRAKAARLLEAALAEAGRDRHACPYERCALAFASFDLKRALDIASCIGPGRDRAVALARLSARIADEANGDRTRLAFALVALDQAVAAAGRVGEGLSPERAEVLTDVAWAVAKASPNEALRIFQLAVGSAAEGG
jgi:hypothetical protein